MPSSEYVPQHTSLLSSGFIDRNRDRNRDGEEEMDGGKTLEGVGALRLTTQEKIELLRPLVVRYMLPLCAVYVEEYVINSVRSFPFPPPSFSSLYLWVETED